jgi:hypothetical protein
MATTPSKVTKIHVKATDNELYILAAPVDGSSSSEVCHIKSGDNNEVDYAVIPQSVLAAGKYTLIMIGINWGGPQAFEVILTDDSGKKITYDHRPPATDTTIGVTWEKAVTITV